MRKTLLLLCGMSVLVSPSGWAQKTVRPQQQAWLGLFSQPRFTDRWGLWLDLHARRIDFLDRWNTILLRPGLTYYVSDQVRLTAGYAYVAHFPANPEAAVRPEHRPWQQLNWTGHLGRLHTNQWVRTEQRFNRRTQGNELGDGYTFNWRFRYMLSAQLPLKGDRVRPGVPNLMVQNEVFINAGRAITYNYFDQNRLFVGLTYPFTKTFTAQAGYMNLFQQQAAGNLFTNNHTLRLFLFYNPDFRPTN